MTNGNTHQLSQDLVVIEEESYEFDPLTDDSFDKSLDNVLQSEGYVGDPSELAPKSQLPVVPEKTPREKIKDLFAEMIPFKRYLLSILEYCVEAKEFSLVDAFVTELQSKRKTIYTAYEFCAMLERAGAIDKVTAEGTPYEDVTVEPVEVERDGQYFLEPGTPPAVYWVVTEAGAEALEEDNPLKALEEIFGTHAQYTGVYKQALELCDQEGGASIQTLSNVVNQNPALHYPNKTVQYFLDYLDRNGAIIWDENWMTTAVGKQALELLHEREEA